MNVFVDTSAFFALLDAEDEHHKQATDVLINLRGSEAHLVTSNYVIAESCALIQRRLGMKVASAFRSNLLPIVAIHWVDESIHDDGFNYFLTCSKGGPSFVDCVSFAVMRQTGIRTAFAFDRHFADQGFK